MNAAKIVIALMLVATLLCAAFAYRNAVPQVGEVKGVSLAEDTTVDAYGQLAAEYPRISLEKTVFEEGEAIWVTPYCTAYNYRIGIFQYESTDWIRFCYIGTTEMYGGVDSNNDLLYGSGSGVPIDVATCHICGTYNNRPEASIPPGHYIVAISQTSRITPFDYIEIDVVRAPQ